VVGSSSDFQTSEISVGVTVACWKVCPGMRAS
jgi:hypothetical protein